MFILIKVLFSQYRACNSEILYTIHRMKTHSFYGIDFVQWHYTDLYNKICERLDHQKSTMIVTPNPEMLYDACYDPVLKWILQNSDFALPDGAGLFVAYQAQSSHMPYWQKIFWLPWWCFRAIIHDTRLTKKYWERMTGSRLTCDLLKYCAAHNIPVIILDKESIGNTEWDKRKQLLQPLTAQKISRIFPGISVFHIIGATSDTIKKAILDLDLPFSLILWTQGGGTQEKILDQIHEFLPKNMTIWVGWSIDLLTWFRSPAPWIFRRFGGEWFYRLLRRPKSHTQRILKVVKFIWLTCIS